MLNLALLATASPALLALPAAAEKTPKGYVSVKDSQDGYSYVYPFGWQEVSIDGQDSVYKDVIEPLESVSVNLIPTDKKTVQEFGEVKDVALTLADKVLTSPEQQVTIINAAERVQEGRTYYDFEFTAKNPRYIRHALASVTVGNGQFYTLVTGSNEKRWNKMAPKIKTVVKSFEVNDRY